MRTFIMFGVISVHTVSTYNGYLSDGRMGSVLFSAFHASIEVTRMAFMFITGFVLFFVYYRRDFHVLNFWKKRFTLVGIPYLFWNLFYLFFIKDVYSPGLFSSFKTFMTLLWESLSRGNLFYIYYVLVTLQFYLVFPIMLFVLRKFEKRHPQIFVWSALLQLLIMSLITFAVPKLDTADWPYLLVHSGSLMLPYVCYFAAGGVAACHYQAIGEFIDRHIRLMVILFAAGFFIMSGHYILVRTFLQYSYSMAISVQQPIYLPYAMLYIGLVMFLGRIWDRHRKKRGEGLFNRFIQIASKASFGTFLIQPIPIYVVSQLIVPRLTGHPWLFYLSLPMAVLFVYFSSMLLAVCFLKTPVLSYCIGVRSKLFQRFKKLKKIEATENPQS